MGRSHTPSPPAIASCNDTCGRPRVGPAFSSHSTILTALLLCEKDSVLYKVFFTSCTRQLLKYFVSRLHSVCAVKSMWLQTWPRGTVNRLGGHLLSSALTPSLKPSWPCSRPALRRMLLPSPSHSGPTSLTQGFPKLTILPLLLTLAYVILTRPVSIPSVATSREPVDLIQSSLY